jgi:hypothetical protein
VKKTNATELSLRNALIPGDAQFHEQTELNDEINPSLPGGRWAGRERWRCRGRGRGAEAAPRARRGRGFGCSWRRARGVGGALGACREREEERVGGG